MRRVPVLIAGAGLAGLSAARRLYRAGVPYILVEREKEVGGLCRSVSRDGYTFDYTGHFLHFKDPAVLTWVKALPGLRLREHRRHAAVFSRGVFTEYPYQENNFGLPAEVVRRNVIGYLEAAIRERFHPPAAPPREFLGHCRRWFGEGITREFMEPYNAKLWKVPLSRLTADWMGRFVPRPRVREVVEGAFGRNPSSAGYNARFFYPEEGGVQSLPEALARGVPPARCGCSLASIDLKGRRALLSDGTEVRYDALLSSLPLPALARLTTDLPPALRLASAGLKAVSVAAVNFGLKRKNPSPYSWVYFPEKSFVFHRAGCLSACVPESAPRGGSSLYMEVSYRGRKPGARALGRRVLSQLQGLGWIRSERDVAVRVDLDLPGAYVLYDRHREKAVPSLLAHLARYGVSGVGRWGLWEYGSMESALEQGREAAQRLI